MVDTRDLKSLAQWGVRVRDPLPVLSTSTIISGEIMQITASKVRQQFTQLLSQLSDGPIEVTKHGKVVAILALPDVLTSAPETTPASPERPLEAAAPVPSSYEAPEPTESLEETSEPSEDAFFESDEETDDDGWVTWTDDDEADFERYLRSVKRETSGLSF